MAVLGLDPRINPAITHPHQIANETIRFSNHPMKMTGYVGSLRSVRQQQGRMA
jgi:hypothetical protein